MSFGCFGNRLQVTQQLLCGVVIIRAIEYNEIFYFLYQNRTKRIPEKICDYTYKSVNCSIQSYAWLQFMNDFFIL